jgi:hypothetical protein
VALAALLNQLPQLAIAAELAEGGQQHRQIIGLCIAGERA